MARAHVVLVALPEVRLTIGVDVAGVLELRSRSSCSSARNRAPSRHTGHDPPRRNHDRSTQQRDDTAPVVWLLQQRRILIHDASVIWVDEQREAPHYWLSSTSEFRLESRLGHYRFGLAGTPPRASRCRWTFAAISMVASVAGLVGRRPGAYTFRLDYADVAAWRRWPPMPIPIASGKGALRLWFDFAEGEARELVADVVLTDVEARLASELPELQAGPAPRTRGLAEGRSAEHVLHGAAVVLGAGQRPRGADRLQAHVA